MLITSKDRNAIVILNSGNRVGYINRELAMVLAPFIVRHPLSQQALLTVKDEEEIVLTAEARGNGPPWEGILHISIWTYEDSGVTREHMGMCVKLARVRPEDDSGETTDY